MASCSSGRMVGSLLNSHVFAPGVPHAAHRSLADLALARADAAAAHLHDPEQIRRAERCALDETWGGPILHRNVACRADEVGLPQPHLGQLWAVVLKSEGRPNEPRPLQTLGDDPAHGQAIADLLQHEARKYGD